MSLKENNEITVKIKCELNEFYKILENREFKVIEKFSMYDSYFVPENLDLKNTSIRDVLSKAVLVRDIRKKISGKIDRVMTFKVKEIDYLGNILNQKSINCGVLEIEDAKNFLNAIGYEEIMNIKEYDVLYEKDGFQLAVKDIENGDKLIEIETEENDELDTIDKLIKKVNEIDLPIYTDNYFVKKAEIELDKVLNRNKEEVEKRNEYCVVSVKYDDYDGDKTYYYILVEDIDETNIGDKVIVDRMGFGTIGTVVEKEFYNRKNAPYPIDMMKEAIRDDR